MTVAFVLRFIFKTPPPSIVIFSVAFLFNSLCSGFVLDKFINSRDLLLSLYHILTGIPT
jgi:hypothetical protein